MTKTKRNTKQSGATHTNCKLTLKKATEIRKFRTKTGLSYSAIAEKYKLSTTTVYRVCTNQVWT